MCIGSFAWILAPLIWITLQAGIIEQTFFLNEILRSLTSCNFKNNHCTEESSTSEVSPDHCYALLLDRVGPLVRCTRGNRYVCGNRT